MLRDKLDEKSARPVHWKLQKITTRNQRRLRKIYYIGRYNINKMSVFHSIKVIILIDIQISPSLESKISKFTPGLFLAWPSIFWYLSLWEDVPGPSCNFLLQPRSWFYLQGDLENIILNGYIIYMSTIYLTSSLFRKKQIR